MFNASLLIHDLWRAFDSCPMRVFLAMTHGYLILTDLKIFLQILGGARIRTGV
tara:strand:- start:146 stop:304 length:159 start_codon:yes stop_codon:yes gene_type:complete